MKIYKGHHIWCNFSNLPVEECEQCKYLIEKYPEDIPIEEMYTKYFPHVKVIK